MSPSLRRALTVVLLALAALFAGAGVASAHAELDSSNPADGANLATAPTRLELRFTLPVELPATRVKLTDAADRPYAVGAASALASGPAGVTAVTVPLPPLAQGSYRLAWSTISTDDLHVVSGTVGFGIGQQAPPSGGVSDPPPDLAESAARWVGFTGLAALLGAAGLGALLGAVRDRARRAEARRVLAGLAVAGGALALAGDIALLVAQAAEAAGTGGSTADALLRFLGTPPRAPRWWARELALVVVLGCAVHVRRVVTARVPAAAGGVAEPERGPARAVVLLGAAAAATVGATGAMLGHSVGSGPLRVATDAVHELSAMTWAGGLIAVVAVLARHPRDATSRALLRRFSLLASACVAVLTATGLLLTGSGVASLDALLLSHFGAALLVKVGLMAVALAVALVNTVAVHDHRRRPPRAALALEAAVLLAALAAAAVLGASPHATGPAWRPPDAAVPLRSAQAADLVESLAVSPNLPGGPNTVTVTVLNTRRPAPAPIGTVAVHVVGSDAAVVDATARPDVPGSWVVTLNRPPAGPWQVTVTVSRAGLAPAVTSFTWAVSDPTAPRRPPVFSADPIDAPLGTAAAIVADLDRRGGRPRRAAAPSARRRGRAGTGRGPVGAGRGRGVGAAVSGARRGSVIRWLPGGTTVAPGR